MTVDRKIDLIDRKILYEIQRQGRIPVVELAERVGLSKTPCLQRLRKLEKDKIIRGYRADIDPAKISQGYLVYVQVKLENTKRVTLENFNAAAKKTPQILTCHMLSGGYDYLLKIRTKNMSTFRELLGDVISDLPGVLQTSTYPVMEQVKETSLLVIDGIGEPV